MEFSELAKKRYSCRNIDEKTVAKDFINEIVDTAISAPTAVNKQPYRLFLMESREAKENIKKVISPKFATADAFLVVGYKEQEAWVREYDGLNFGIVDASIVATHIMLEITDLGLATTWIGHFNAPVLKQMYEPMKDYELIAVFPIGYESKDAEPSFRHFERKDRGEILKTL